MMSAGWIGDWRPGIGDPTFAGLAHGRGVLRGGVVLFAGTRCRPALLEPRGSAGLHRLSGESSPSGLAALGVNKQLDLQSAVTELGRMTARAQGWYDHKAAVQRGFVEVVAVLAIGLCLGLAVLARRELRRVAVALIGWTALCLFVGIRAASFHHVDRLLGMRWGRAPLNAILELGGIAVIAIGAIVYRRGAR